MPGMVIRLGDMNCCGGMVLTGVPNVRAGGKPVATAGAPITPHPNGKPPHTAAKILPGSNTSVRAGGKPIAITGDRDSCGHSHVMGSPTVRIGG